MESSITTNGILLADLATGLKEAGLRRVNVSLDSLNPDTYKKIAGMDRLHDVLVGIDAALDAGSYTNQVKHGNSGWCQR